MGVSCLLLSVLCGAFAAPLKACVVPDAVVPDAVVPDAVVPLRCLCSAPCCGSSEMSHVIPSHVFQTLKSHRWNCNVFLGPKKSEGTQITCDFWGGARPGHPNYVRLLIYQARGSNSCVRSPAQDAVHTPPRLCVLPAYAEQSLRPERIGLKAQTSPCTRCW